MEELKSDRVILFVANRCKQLRPSKNLTQLDVVNDTGVSIGRIEMGNMDITISTLQRLADFFEISLTDFFSDHE